jgi:hypothetical protein
VEGTAYPDLNIHPMSTKARGATGFVLHIWFVLTL